MRRLHAAVSLALGLCLPSPAAAGEGVLEINQACAVNTGCFAGDDPGFPVTIGSAPAARDFRLTGDLVIVVFDTNVIEITASDVTLDLNGFSIRCESLVGPHCTGSGRGIHASGVNVAILDGSVRGMADFGVFAAAGARIERVRAIENGDGVNDGGILVGEGSLVERCVALSNTGSGVAAGSGSLVRGNVVRLNTFRGLSLRAPQGENEAAYRANVIDANPGGTVLGGVDAGANVCDGSATCP